MHETTKDRLFCAGVFFVIGTFVGTWGTMSQYEWRAEAAASALELLQKEEKELVAWDKSLQTWRKEIPIKHINENHPAEGICSLCERQMEDFFRAREQWRLGSARVERELKALKGK